MAHLFRYRFRYRWRAIGLMFLLGGLLVGAPARAQVLSEAAVKAGFVFNFIQFTQWPNANANANASAKEGERAPLLVCATEVNPLDGQLALLNGRPVGARQIEVRTQVPASDWRTCQVGFLSGSDTARVEVAIRGLGTAPVLTLSDVPGFVQVNGMIGLRLEDNRMRFDVNLGAAQRAGLQLNSQMVNLAGKVLR